MILFTILGLSPLQWFLYVDLPLSIIFIIAVAANFKKIKAWAKLKKAFKSYMKYEYDEDFGEEYDEDHNKASKIDMRSSNEKRIDTMMERYGVPFAFLLKNKNKE